MRGLQAALPVAPASMFMYETVVLQNYPLLMIDKNIRIIYTRSLAGALTVALAIAKLASPETALTLFSDLMRRLTLWSGKICMHQEHQFVKPFVLLALLSVPIVEIHSFQSNRAMKL